MNFKIPTIVGILKFMTRKNAISCCYEQDNCLICLYSKTCVKQPLSKKKKIGFQDQLLLNAGQKYCRMEHSAILLTFIKLLFSIKTFVLSTFKWMFYTGFTVF